MKNLRICLGLFLFVSLLTSCDMLYSEDAVPSSNDEFGSGVNVDPNNGNQVSDEIDFDGGKTNAGHPPRSSQTNYTSKIWGNLQSIKSTKDQIIFIPFEFECSPQADGISYVYAQVEGANDHWEIDYHSTNQIRGQVVLKVKLPGNIQNGNFRISYAIQDDYGRVSNYLETYIYIIDVATCDGSAFEGEDGLTVRSYDMGTTPGTIRVTYDMYTVPDRIDVFYDGKWEGGTGKRLNYGQHPPQSKCYDGADGYTGGSGFFDIPYNPNKSRRLNVYVSGCNGGGTGWTVWVECI